MIQAEPNPEASAVLLVEDEPLARKWFVRSFSDEFRLLAVDGVDAALSMLRDCGQQIAVLLTDYNMPQRNGLELLRVVQREYRHLVPLLCTAYADKDMAIAAVNEGRVFRILEKPLDGQATRQALRDALSLYRQQTRERALHLQRVGAMRETLGFLAHELNTPMATVRGYMGVLRDRYKAQESTPGQAVFIESQAGEVISAIDAAERRALYCQSLVNTFVQSARDAHPGALHQPVQAGALVRSLLDTYPFDGEQRDWVACRVHEDFHLPGRRDLLYLVLCTLAKNALQALNGRPVPQLRIEVGRDHTPHGPARPWIRLADNGPGIPADLLPRLTLEPVSARPDAGGHGMGLVFCRRVMQSAGGSIELRSEPGHGTQVSLLFPDVEEIRPP